MAGDPGLEKVRRAYERGRLARALFGALPVIVVAAVAALVGDRPRGAILIGLGLACASILFSWRGRELGRAVLPGIAAGTIPLALSLGARSFGHVCAGGSCVSLCVPACTAGGLIAGAIIAFASRGAASPRAFWLAAASLSLSTGALGCSCVGFGGVIGLAIGLVASAVPSMPRLAASARP